MIRLIHFKDMDWTDYERMVQASAVPKIYFKKEYMEAAHGPAWAFLMSAGGTSVMPIPLKKKFGIRYVVKPYGYQQLGVLGHCSALELAEYADYLAKKFFVRFYPFNCANAPLAGFENRINYLIRKSDYETVRKGYTVDRRRNVRTSKLSASDWNLVPADNLENIKTLFFAHAEGLDATQKKEFWRVLVKLFDLGFLFIVTLYWKNEPASTAVLVDDAEEIGLLAFINQPAFGKMNFASILIDQILQREIEKRDFSFMGGNIPAIGEFFRRFGAEKLLYPFMEEGGSPLTHPLKLLRRQIF